MAAFSVKQIKAFLTEMGIPAENLDSAAENLCARHNTVLDGIKEERDTYKQAAETLASVQKELDDLKAKADDGFKERYEAEHRAFEDFKKNTEHAQIMEKRKAAFLDVLTDANILDDKARAKILKYADLESLGDLDENGKFSNAADVLKFVKTEWPEHISTTRTKGAPTPTPVGDFGDDLAGMTVAELSAYANQHPERASEAIAAARARNNKKG